MTGAALAQAALDLNGTRFRLHGRHPDHGLDCIGVLAASLSAIGRPASIPNGYPLRLARLNDWLPSPKELGFTAIDAGEFRPGDVLLLDCSGGQFHLAIATGGEGFVHAHAGLRRVVHSPACPQGTPVGHWRLNPKEEEPWQR